MKKSKTKKPKKTRPPEQLTKEEEDAIQQRLEAFMERSVRR